MRGPSPRSRRSPPTSVALEKVGDELPALEDLLLRWSQTGPLRR